MLEHWRQTKTCRAPTALMIVLSLVVQGTHTFCAFADEAQSEVILSNLPPRTGASYRKLKELADNGHNDVLEMSNSEAWSFPSPRLAKVLDWARENNVSATVLDKNWNRMLDLAPTGASASAAKNSIMKQTMLCRAALGSSVLSLPKGAALEYALTKKINATQAQASTVSLFTTLNDDTEVSAHRTSLIKTASGYIWHGMTNDTGEPVTLLWWASGRLTGTITYRGRKYAIKKLAGSTHAVVEMEPRLLPPEHQSMKAEDIRKGGLLSDPLVLQGDASLAKQVDAAMGNRTTNLAASRKYLDFKTVKPTAGSVTMRVIVAYTKQAASHYHNIEQDLIALAIEETNQSFRNSGIEGVSLELAYAYQTNYNESGTHFDHVFRLAYKNDGYMDEVHRLRSKHRANIGILLVHDPNGCGLSAQVAAPADKAFAAIHHECAALSYSFAHEIGHLIGARHDLGVDDTLQPFPFGHGFVSPTNTWRDIMSYEESCGGCPRLPVWSNPDIKFNGMSVGDELRNNARVIRERAPIVAKF
jgi:Metallo-peptidase family M12